MNKETENQEINEIDFQSRRLNPEEIRRNKLIVVYNDDTKKYAIHLANICSYIAHVTCWSRKTYLANEDQMNNQNIILFLDDKSITENLSAPSHKIEELTKNSSLIRDGKRYGICLRDLDGALDILWNDIVSSATNIQDMFSSLFTSKKPQGDETIATVGDDLKSGVPIQAYGPLGAVASETISVTQKAAAIKDKVYWDSIEKLLSEHIEKILNDK